MAQVAELPHRLIGAPGRNISESLCEKVAWPVYEGRTITNRGDVRYMAVLVYQFIQNKEAAALVRGRHTCHGGLPDSIHHSSMRDKFRVSQRRLIRPGGKIVE